MSAGSTILFVCTANICRSPTAERLARRHEGADRFTFASAGFLEDGRRCPDKLLMEVARRGVDLSSHESRTLTAEMLADADLVITMEVAHLREIALLDASAFAKTIPFLELDRMLSRRPRSLDELLRDLEGRDPASYLTVDGRGDVPDPYRRSARAYREAVEMIDGLVQNLCTKLLPREESTALVGGRAVLARPRVSVVEAPPRQVEPPPALPRPAVDRTPPTPPTARTDHSPAAHPVGRRPRWRLLVLALAVALVLYGAVTGFLLFQAVTSAEAARDRLDVLGAEDPLELQVDTVRRDVEMAAADLEVARRNLTSPVLLPLRPVPVVGRQLASARALAVASDDVADRVSDLLDRVTAARAAGSAPAERMSVLAGLEEDLAGLEQIVAAPELGPDEGLVEPLRDARREAEEQFGELAAHVDDGLVVVRGLQGFLGDSNYLILGGHNAVMGIAGGRYLTLGDFYTDEGSFELAELRHSLTTAPPPGVEIVDPDVAARWGDVEPASDFMELNVSPRFDEFTGPQALAMWEAVTGRRANGVIALDPYVIQAILGVVGPVDVAGTNYDDEEFLEFAFVGQYEAFDDDDQQAQLQRRALVDQISRRAVVALGERSWDPLDLIRSLRAVARGRHLLAFSEDPAQQAMWARLGVDGSMDGDELLISVNNLAMSALDPFVDVEVTADVSEQRGARQLALEVTVTNEAPPDVEGRTAGDDRLLGEHLPGTYVGRIAIYAPAGTSNLRFTNGVPLETQGADGNLVMIAGLFNLEPGATAEFGVVMDLEASRSRIEVLPSARPEPATWHVRGDTLSDTSPRWITLS